jgi:hypothetical protein
MSKEETKTVSNKNPEDKISKIDFRFGADSKIQPAGLDKITMGTEVTVMLKGKITSFSADETWDKSKRFSLQMSSCEIMAPETSGETSMDDALNEANNTRKKMA